MARQGTSIATPNGASHCLTVVLGLLGVPDQRFGLSTGLLFRSPQKELHDICSR